jgi:hypothetical protein
LVQLHRDDVRLPSVPPLPPDRDVNDYGDDEATAPRRQISKSPTWTNELINAGLAYVTSRVS